MTENMQARCVQGAKHGLCAVLPLFIGLNRYINYIRFSCFFQAEKPTFDEFWLYAINRKPIFVQITSRKRKNPPFAQTVEKAYLPRNLDA